jgi:hypothetical protein
LFDIYFSTKTFFHLQVEEFNVSPDYLRVTDIKTATELEKVGTTSHTETKVGISFHE